jgi:hypothetical protein
MERDPDFVARQKRRTETAAALVAARTEEEARIDHKPTRGDVNPILAPSKWRESATPRHSSNRHCKKPRVDATVLYQPRP